MKRISYILCVLLITSFAKASPIDVQLGSGLYWDNDYSGEIYASLSIPISWNNIVDVTFGGFYLFKEPGRSRPFIGLTTFHDLYNIKPIVIMTLGPFRGYGAGLTYSVYSW